MATAEWRGARQSGEHGFEHLREKERLEILRRLFGFDAVGCRLKTGRRLLLECVRSGEDGCGDFVRHITSISACNAPAALFVDLDVGSIDFGRRARRREYGGLRNLGGFGDLGGEVSLRDRDRRDPHILAHHDNSRLFVDNDTGGLIGLDPKLLDIGQERNDAPRIVFGDRERDRTGVYRPGLETR